MTGKPQDTLHKAARLLILLEMQDNGKTVSKAELSRILRVSRFTIYRDLADIDTLRATLADMRKKISHV
jgi:predicted DNA-binding transcriptional regulator YafY